MRAIIFYNVAEYCDHSSKMTIKLLDNKIRTEIWDSGNQEITTVTNNEYFTKKRAYGEFQKKIGAAILGGWNVLNVYPERETWETKRSK